MADGSRGQDQTAEQARLMIQQGLPPLRDARAFLVRYGHLSDTGLMCVMPGRDFYNQRASDARLHSNNALTDWMMQRHSHGMSLQRFHVLRTDVERATWCNGFTTRS